MKLTGTALAALILCGLITSAQEFIDDDEAKDREPHEGWKARRSHWLRGTCRRYVLTKSGSLVYMFVTDHYLTNFVGRIVEVKGLAAAPTTSTTTRAEGHMETPVLLMQSIKTFAYSCR